MILKCSLSGRIPGASFLSGVVGIQGPMVYYYGLRCHECTPLPPPLSPGSTQLEVAHFLSVDVISSTVRSNHGVALLMAAIMHDYRHPGVNNGYLVRDLDPLAVTYNDASVLENFHAAEGFKMMLHQKFDVFKVSPRR